MGRHFWAPMLWIAVAKSQGLFLIFLLLSALSDTEIWVQLLCDAAFPRDTLLLCQLTLGLVLPASSSSYFWKISFHHPGAWKISVVLVYPVLAADTGVSGRFIGLFEPHMMFFRKGRSCSDERQTGARRTQALCKPHTHFYHGSWCPAPSLTSYFPSL